MLVSQLAHADIIGNDLDLSVDASLETMNLVVGGADDSVAYTIYPLSGDGKTGCNFSADSALNVNVQSSNPGAATVSPSTLTFVNCTDTKTVTVHPVAQGTSTVSLAVATNTTQGSFDLSAASFAVKVAVVPPPDTTAPVITAKIAPTPNDAGWNKSNVTLEWKVEDSESLVTSKTGCETRVQVAETSGLTFTCRAESAGGTSSASATLKIDKTVPGVSILTPINGAEYELHSDVKADWSAEDTLSGVASAIGTVADGAALDTATAGAKSFTVTATDRAGNLKKVTVRYTVKEADEDDEDEDEDEDHDEEDEDHETFIEMRGPLFHRMSFHLGSTIPIRFRIVDDDGDIVTDMDAKLFVDGQVAIGKKKHHGNEFRMKHNGGFHFNLSTKHLSAGEHTVKIVLEDGTTKEMKILLVQK